MSMFSHANSPVLEATEVSSRLSEIRTPMYPLQLTPYSTALSNYSKWTKSYNLVYSNIPEYVVWVWKFLIERTRKNKYGRCLTRSWDHALRCRSAFPGVLTLTCFLVRRNALDILFNYHFQPNIVRDISAASVSFSHLIRANLRRWCLSVPNRQLLRNLEETFSQCLQNSATPLTRPTSCTVVSKRWIPLPSSPYFPAAPAAVRRALE